MTKAQLTMARAVQRLCGRLDIGRFPGQPPSPIMSLPLTPILAATEPHDQRSESNKSLPVRVLWARLHPMTILDKGTHPAGSGSKQLPHYAPSISCASVADDWPFRPSPGMTARPSLVKAHPLIMRLHGLDF